MINPDARVREANDRRYQRDIRSLGVSVEACITSELNNGKFGIKTYSTNGGCADFDYLKTGGYLTSNYSVDPTIHLLVNAGYTQICIYAENTNGNGIISFQTSTGVVSQPGEGKTICP